MIYPVVAHGKRWRIDAHPESRIARDLATRQPYESGLLDHIYSLDLRGYAIDVGASIGNHTLYFVRACGLPVIAFEPIFGDEFVGNIALNRTVAPYVTLHRVALGARKGHATDGGDRVLTEDEDEEARARPARAEGKLTLDDEGSIEVRRLDSFEIPSPVALIKIDVEGMEPEVLKGAHKTIERDQPLIFAEASSEAARDAQAEVLEPLGYRINPALGPKATSTRVYRWDYIGS